MDQTALIQSAQLGNLDSFNQLVLAYQDRIFNTALRMLGDEDCAADAAQNAFILAFRNITNLRGGCFGAWLLRILKNVCYDELRRQRRRSTLPLEPIVDDEEFDSPGWLADFSHEPARNVEFADLTRAIQVSLQTLLPEYRMIIVLVDIEGLDYAEAAAITGVPIGTVKSRLARARRRLRNELQHYADLLPDVCNRKKAVLMPEMLGRGIEVRLERLAV
jgi:RNA polymerase sigma-70 factor (ECF subfamily)